MCGASMTEIVKVQRPVIGDEWLIYDKDKNHVEQLPDRLVSTYIKAAMRNDHVAYFGAAWSSIVGWGLSRRVKDQNW